MRVVALAILLVAAGLAGCAAPAPAALERPEGIGVHDTAPGTTLTFDVPRPVPAAKYVWSFGDGGSSLGTTARYAWDVPGVYTVAWQEVQGESVARASVGLVRVHQTIALEDRARARSPSEAHFDVHGNASALAITLTTSADEGDATATLVDPAGMPVLSVPWDLRRGETVALATTDPVPGSWFVYVETSLARLDWTGNGTVRYGLRGEPVPASQ